MPPPRPRFLGVLMSPGFTHTPHTATRELAARLLPRKGTAASLPPTPSLPPVLASGRPRAGLSGVSLPWGRRYRVTTSWPQHLKKRLAMT